MTPRIAAALRELNLAIEEDERDRVARPEVDRRDELARKRARQTLQRRGKLATERGTVIGDARDEARLHDRFARHRVRGEWFEGSILPSVEALIEEWRPILESVEVSV